MAKKKIAKKEVKAKKQGKRSKVAFVLVFIATLILLINSLLLILARNQLAVMLARVGYTASPAALTIYGIIWLVLAVLIWITMHRIENKNIKSEKWFLLALSIITIFPAGRWESGILTLIAAIIYLRQK